MRFDGNEVVTIQSLSLRDAWVKAAVEHRTLKIRYYSGGIKDEVSDREVEPDYIVTSDGWRGFGCWGYCRLRNHNRVFNVIGINEWFFTGNEFRPNPNGRWRELLPYYHEYELGLIIK